MYIKGKTPSVTTCVDGNNKPNGDCYCELEKETNVITGTVGKVTQKMIGDIQCLFSVVRTRGVGVCVCVVGCLGDADAVSSTASKEGSSSPPHHHRTQSRSPGRRRSLS